MDKKSVFGLDPDQLDELLSLGSDAVDGPGLDGKPGVPSPSVSSEMFVEPPGSRIGRYRLLNVLGEGGMGIVYRAGQEHPITRDVALKIIKPGMDSARVIARFEAERQALALLDHPNIAHVYDAGAAENGRPYFVMEYVEGVSITEHCDRHRLTIEDRLNLFLQVCHAVQHAHQKGIIHRDIKPSNILISFQEDQAVPKIIDFGVAKAVDQPLTEKTLFTEQGQLFGTPEYMSPEQADMANEDIDTRSDVYSLGVLLYTLLTGALPFDSDTLREGGIDHIRKVIRETDPKTPSTRLTNLGERAERVAESRRTEVGALAKCLHKELEWIPLKAMRKERLERYQSASELADDIENYLKGAALIAGPPSTVYRLTKFVRRNRVLVAAVAAVLVVLVGGIVVSMVFAIGQARARAEAEQQETVARAVTDYVTNDLLQGTSPDGTGGRELTSRLLLDTASENIQRRLGDKPLVEAAVRSRLGSIYRRLGEFDAAEQHLKRALHIQQKHLDPEHLDTLETTHRLIRLYTSQERYRKAEPLAIKTYEIRRRLLGDEHRATLASHQDLAWVYRGLGQYDKAEPLHVENLKMTRWVLGEECVQTTSAMKGLGILYRLQGRYDEAVELLAEALDIDRRVCGEESPFTLSSAFWLAIAYTDQGRYGNAEDLLIEVVNGRTRLHGESHPRTLSAINELIKLYEAWNKPEKAEEWRAKLP